MKASARALNEAIRASGGITRMARVMNEHQSARSKKSKTTRFTIHRWVGKGEVPAEKARLVESVSGVAKERLRPDIFLDPEICSKTSK